MMLSELGVKVEERENLDADGHYVAYMNTIVIKANLSKYRRQRTLLHELGHASKHHDNYFLYNLAFSLHSKMEYEADRFMIENLLDSYIAKSELEPHNINYMKFIEDNNLSVRFEPLVKELLKARIYCYVAL
ncbi:ImmA/IrrE family metallo-endopeptidase [Enterococcus faecium]|uniref:ImmA/IrrE family metallo-endopeptidase n=1 Tax=Enterococcus faecium TaxID=1352 RepID=UPI00177D0474|nr:ImmA/IrrE family metallo-endopeptidase [Enterococcus faecium]MBD9712270.1 ImmA/IrrE family metallo-endopeptidase [Enterococcus faecium]MBD9715176.1 ImmA/IrrE family metallo-endopeptidase [Enterococcus faecium]MBD9737026.1 ImmA/IrrE family metallo-endopeptidase [Enterococcus faecium]